MRRGLVALVIALAISVPAWSALPHGSFAQSATNLPAGDEFNNTTFNAPFVGYCGPLAGGQCPDAQGPSTWSLDTESPQNLRIWTQAGTLQGPYNNARNLFIQNQIDPNSSWTITTKLMFPAQTQGRVNTLGQTAGIIVMQDQDNFIFVGRVFTNDLSGIPSLEFVQESAGVDTTSTVLESSSTVYVSPLYVRLTKTGNTYTGYYSYDNATWTQFTAPPINTTTPTSTPTQTPTATPSATATSTTVTPVAFTATYSPLAVGVFAWGGTDTSANTNLMAADFDWFRVGNSTVAAPTATPTNTPVPSTTATNTPTSTPTSTPTTTATPTNTPTPTPTNTPVPTQTPIVRVRTIVKHPLGFKYVSLWYHPVRPGQHNHLQIQSNMHVKQGIWVHMFFPNGKHLDWYKSTDNSGFWSTDFTVPTNISSPNGDKVVITFQLWHGKHFAKRFLIWPLT